MNNQFNEYGVKDESTSEVEETIPSRKKRHPKPKSFLEKPIFSLIVFILFIFILGGIFIYYNYNVNQPLPKNQSKQNEEFKSTDDNQKGIATLDSDIQPSYSNVIDDINNENKEVNPEATEDSPPEEKNESSLSNSESVANDTNNKVDEQQSITYVVKSKDTLYSIAKKYYHSTQQGIKEIQEANALQDNSIKINMKLIIPKPTKNP